jgi:hypothetical protein
LIQFECSRSKNIRAVGKTQFSVYPIISIAAVVASGFGKIPPFLIFVSDKHKAITKQRNDKNLIFHI